jgi:enamine deaminase RidA (YjgF/YER057c/UK114 family)
VDQQLAWLRDAYDEVLATLELSPDTSVFRRFYCSDPRNQAESFETHPFSNPLHGDPPCAVSWVGQPPEPPAKVVLWAQHIHDPSGLETAQEGTSVSLARNGLSHHWTTNVLCTRLHTSLDQTRGIFESYDTFLNGHGMTLQDHVIRTWFFVRHVDVNYKGLVVARRKLFSERGLTPETHFIASTGIEGISALDSAKVAMDAYAVGGVLPEQVEYIEALDHLGPTHVYGVTFERATSVAYRDRKHVFISGTASIDPEGNILHEGDVARQLDRALENVEALLAQCGAGLGDMAAYTAYVRDPSDQSLIRQRMREQLGDAPVAVVVAPVCRPGWLIELEGRAIVATERPELPTF